MFREVPVVTATPPPSTFQQKKNPEKLGNPHVHHPPDVDLAPGSAQPAQVYFVVALFRAAEPRVMEAAARGLDLMPLLGGGEALEGYDWESSLSFMEGLERRHRHRCLAAATRGILSR